MTNATVAAFRFGFGLPLPGGAATEPAAMLAALAGPDVAAGLYPAPGTGEILGRIGAFQLAARKLRQARQAGTAAIPAGLEAARMAAVQAIAAGVAAGSRAALSRALASPDGLRERLVLFWADHFTVGIKAPWLRELPGAVIADAIRPNLTGRFADLLTAVETHPSMLIYLDQVTSVGPGSEAGIRQGKGLNENLAREMMELHTLGAGAAYSQQDVRQLAELLTGLGLQPGEGFRFFARRAEPGPETVLGVIYPANSADGMVPIRAVLADLAIRPETARYLAGKIARHFVADVPDPALVSALEVAWLKSGGDLMTVYGALLSHPAAWTEPGAKVRPPLEFVLAALRALGVGPNALAAMPDRRLRHLVFGPMGPMGQPWQNPRGPDGWPEAAADWITPQGLGARIRWAMEVPAQLVPALPDPRVLLDRALGDLADERLIWAVGAAENRAEGVGLVLASPAFNRR